MIQRFFRILNAPLAVLLSSVLLLSGCTAEIPEIKADEDVPEPEEEIVEYDGTLRIENGAAQPMLNYSPSDSGNEGSDILRFCVYVETDHDTDADGKNDLVKAFVQVPRSAAEGKYKAAVIYDPTPYSAGITNNDLGHEMFPYSDDDFDYDDLYNTGDSRVAETQEDTLTAAENADPYGWTYTFPGSDGNTGFYDASLYDYYLIRGFAVVEACGIGTYGSEGYELCGMDLERDSHKCIVEWLTGDRAAFSDKEGKKEICADWCNKNVAMTGCSYGGTLPFEVATTGVKGLKTIIPFAGIANWYDYSNSQGISICGSADYTDNLAAFNSGGLYLDAEWRVMNDRYCAFLNRIAEDEKEAAGLFAPVWQKMDYSGSYEDIGCTALIIHGLNDFNVQTKHAEAMYNAFKKAGKNVKLILHQDGHNNIFGQMVRKELFDELVNKWLCHYLYDVDNGIEDMPEITVQSNIDGTYEAYDVFPDTDTLKLGSDRSGDETLIRSDDLKGFYEEYVDSRKVVDRYYLEQDEEYAKVFDLKPENEEPLTFIGTPEVKIRLKPSDITKDNMMVTAVLLDTDENNKVFNAFITGNSVSDILPFRYTDPYEFGGGHGDGYIREFVQSPTDVKAVSYGWTNLLTPDRGNSASEYTEKSVLEEDEYYTYNIYLQPTVYTLRPGHTLKLAILAQDPQRVLADETENDNTPYFIDDYSNPDYSFTIDEASLEVKLDVIDMQE
ncbi:MAG: hypothetical protein K6F86_08680 [Lachnospiraceae bacterium]|nr:hypothetical protein [Lachnospiraceae bacterium]